MTEPRIAIYLPENFALVFDFPILTLLLIGVFDLQLFAWIFSLPFSRSFTDGFYAYHGRPPSDPQIADEALTDRIAAIRKASKETHGAPRIHAELAEDGIHVGRERMERLMNAKDLRGVGCRKFVATTARDPRTRPACPIRQRKIKNPNPQLLVRNKGASARRSNCLKWCMTRAEGAIGSRGTGREF